MTLRYLLDTNVVSAPIAAVPNASIERKLAKHGHLCAIAAPVWHELLFGVRRLPAGRRRDAIDTYVHDVVRASFPILAYDEAAARWHAEERARLEALGAPAPFVDGQIAAIASANELTLVTANASDFRRFDGIVLEDWSKAKRAKPRSK